MISDVQIHVLEYNLIIVFFPESLGGNLRHRLSPGRRPWEPFDAHHAQQRIHRESKHRDPSDIGQDHVHRKISPHQKDSITKAFRRGDRFRGDEKQPRGSQTQAQCIDESRPHLRHDDSNYQKPGGGAQSLGLDHLFGRQFFGSQGEIAHHDGCDTDDDQQHFREFAQSGDDEQNRENRQGWNQGYRRDERRQSRLDIGDDADRKPERYAQQSTDSERNEDSFEARGCIHPKQNVSAAFVFLESVVMYRGREGRRRRQKLIAGVGSEPRIRIHQVGCDEQNEWHHAQDEQSTSAGTLIHETAHRLGRSYNWPSKAIFVYIGSKRIFTLFESPNDLPAGNWMPTTSGELAPWPRMPCSNEK